MPNRQKNALAKFYESLPPTEHLALMLALKGKGVYTHFKQSAQFKKDPEKTPMVVILETFKEYGYNVPAVPSLAQSLKLSK